MCEVCMRVCEVLIISPQHFRHRPPSNLGYGAYESTTNTLVQCMEDALQGTLNTVEGLNVNECKYGMKYELTLDRRVRCQSSLPSRQ